ncbi:hypothetical protein BGZ74_007463 [Mortierella antarctica]|nr:hypothetical protein BGZ74_007463 [Mortierella antarctica]
MDALAAYGSDSDDSGTESITTPVPTSAIKTTSTPGSKPSSSLSSMLPPPKSGSTPTSSNPLSLPPPTKSAPSQPKPKGGKYSTMPTLEPDSDSEEEESEFRKKAKLASGLSAGTGLFDLLPAPKNAPVASSSPGTATGGAKSSTAKPSFMPRNVKSAAKPTRPVSQKAEDKDEDEDDDDDEPVSFFPLGAAATKPATSSSSSSGKASNTFIPLFFDKKPLTTEEKKRMEEEANTTYVEVSASNEQYAYPSNEQYGCPSNDQYAYPTNDQYAYPTNDQYAYDQYTYPTSEAYGYDQAGSSTGQSANSANVMTLDEASMSRLGARRARDAPIQVVDVRAADQMSQAQHVRNAMAGSSSQPKPVDLASINHLKPTAQLKRKHNIMSLAYQAKANEAQLNAQWAASRQTKAETQSKYGF